MIRQQRQTIIGKESPGDWQVICLAKPKEVTTLGSSGLENIMVGDGINDGNSRERSIRNCNWCGTDVAGPRVMTLFDEV